MKDTATIAIPTYYLGAGTFAFWTSLAQAPNPCTRSIFYPYTGKKTHIEEAKKV